MHSDIRPEVIMSAARQQQLVKLLTTTIAEKLPSREIIMQESFKLSDIVGQMHDGEVVITNDDYEKDQRDFKIIQKDGRVLLDVSPDGNQINRVDIDVYCNDLERCTALSTVFNRLLDCDFCIVTY